MHEYRSEFASEMTEFSIRRAVERNYNIIMESTFRTAKALPNTSKFLHPKPQRIQYNGYRADAHSRTCDCGSERDICKV
ncbi:MAG: zeta toxin family protein, partial [Campylobacteraceae bacterium]|nr:zeta toxin family protein [Campylobacteraceae bacterium]